MPSKVNSLFPALDDCQYNYYQQQLPDTRDCRSTDTNQSLFNPLLKVFRVN